MITININELKTPEQIDEAYQMAFCAVSRHESGETDDADAWHNYNAICEFKKNPAPPEPPPALLGPEWAFIDEHEPEWKQAWLSFEDPSQLNHGETLQYMGSDNRTGTWKHCFRHRCDPITGERKYYQIDASPNWKPQSASPCRF